MGNEATQQQPAIKPANAPIKPAAGVSRRPADPAPGKPIEGPPDSGEVGDWRVFHPEYGAFIVHGCRSHDEAKMKWLQEQFPDASQDPEFVRCHLRFNMRAQRLPDWSHLPPGVAPPTLNELMPVDTRGEEQQVR